MKRISRVIMLAMSIAMIFSGSVFAAENEYILTKEFEYESLRRTALKSGYVEIYIGNSNFTQYQDDKSLVITPLPDEIVEDEFGNQYAYFDVKGLLPNQKFKVTIKREAELKTYTETIPTRSDALINDESKEFLRPTKRIESENPEIIAKAKELTEGLNTDYKKAQAIFEYVNVNMIYDTSATYANKGAAIALKNMRGVCEEFTTLFISMCRALEIPARAVEGYRLENAYASGDTTDNLNIEQSEIIGKNIVNHLWAEIYLEDFGWVPVEPTVIYTVNGERSPYFDAFCKLKEPEYFSIGIYNPERPNRKIANVEETKHVERIELKDSIPSEPQNKFTDLEFVSWASGDIQSLYAKGIVQGYSETEYMPQKNISRIEFITMLSRLLKYNETQSQEKGMVYYYLDYDEEHWSKNEYDYLFRCYEAVNPGDVSACGFYSIANIFGTESLNPNKAITRAEVVAMMDLFLDGTEDSTISFSDVKKSTQFADSIKKAAANGLINGYEDGTFKPYSPITRAEMAAILGRYISGNTYVINFSE